MTDLRAELRIIEYKKQDEVEEGNTWGQEVKYISTSMEEEINNRPITDLEIIPVSKQPLEWMHSLVILSLSTWSGSFYYQKL